MRITAVVTTHRRPRDLARALESVLSQTLPVGEVVVVEDGADRETARVVRDASARAVPIPVRHVRVSPGSCAPASSRNLGMHLARAEFVAFLDDDDVWLPEKNAQQSAALDHADLVCGNARRSDGALYFRDRTDRPIGSRELRDHNPVITSTVVASRSLLVACGGFCESPLVRGGEDFDLWLRVRDSEGQLHFLDVELATYAVASEGRMSARQRRNARALLVVRARDVARRPMWLHRWIALGRAFAALSVVSLPRFMAPPAPRGSRVVGRR